MFASGLSDAEMFRLVAWALAAYRQERDWDDLFQEGLIRAWTYGKDAPSLALARYRVVKAARWGAIDCQRRERRQGPAETIPWEDWDGESPDFSDGLADRLDAARAARAALAVMDERERRYVRLWIGGEVDKHALAAAEGVKPAQIMKIIRRGLARARSCLGDEAPQA